LPEQRQAIADQQQQLAVAEFAGDVARYHFGETRYHIGDAFDIAKPARNDSKSILIVSSSTNGHTPKHCVNNKTKPLRCSSNSIYSESFLTGYAIRPSAAAGMPSTARKPGRIITVVDS
jgi:hypothetical protein